MIAIGKMLSSFSKIKQLKIHAQTTQNRLKINSLTHEHQWEVDNALQTLLSALAGCQIATLQALTKRGSFQVKDIKFNRIEGSYDLSNFKKGGKDNKLEEVIIEAEFQTTGTQEELDLLHKKVEMACPVYQMITNSGVRVTNTWKNIQTA